MPVTSATRVRPGIARRGIVAGCLVLLASSGAGAFESLVAGTPEDVFADIRTTVRSMRPDLVDGSKLDIFNYRNDDGGTTYAVRRELVPESFGIEPSDPFYLLVMLAGDMEALSANLTRLGVPAKVWRDHVRLLEIPAIRLIRGLQNGELAPGSAVHDEAMKYLRADRKYFLTALQESLHEHSGVPAKGYPVPPNTDVYEVFPECCGGEVMVTIKTRPPGARVSYISLFKYALCERRGRNPDREDCGWVSAVNERELMSGKYRFVAEWSDGVRRSGVLDIADPDATTVTISR